MIRIDLEDPSGLDRCLDELKKKSQLLEESYNFSLAEFVTPEFLSKHTKFTSLEEMLSAAQAMKKREWQQIIHTAVKEWFTNKLGPEKIFK